MEMWHWGTWLNGYGGGWLVVGLDNLGLNDSLIL